MRKLFGTDGIRGKANQYPMTGDVAFKLGQAVAKQFYNNHKTKVIIGKDTRRSGYIFEYALTSGLCSMGVDVYLVGPMPTPAIAHLVRSFGVDIGVVISASHNPAGDNGIKFFDNNGFKLPDDVEEQIENLMQKDDLTKDIDIKDVGRAWRIDDAAGRYIEFAKASINKKSLTGLKIVIDCAHGAAYKVAPLIFSELGAEIIAFGVQPDGLNINQDCGATHIGLIQEEVVKNKADIGIALDGDADRIIIVDETGEEVDGDQILAIAATEMIKEDRLPKSTIVATQYSNMGLDDYMKSLGGDVVRVLNGDRYVIEEMEKNSYILGGEKTGHIIFSEFNSTGDGIVSGLQILKIMKEKGKKLSLLKNLFIKYPQVLENIEVTKKTPLEKMPTVQKAIEEITSTLKGRGRILVRYSGTENKCRVMVEGKDIKEIKQCVTKIIDAIRKEIGA